MAYLIFWSAGEEVGRRALPGPTVIGRSPECDISVRDILLSRRHCRVEPAADGRHWAVVDLGSKNGTRVGGRRVASRLLCDGDELVIGKVRVTFRAGELAGAPAGSGEKAPPLGRRPADPTEANSGTVSAMEVVPRGGGSKRPLDRLPTPRPAPPDPEAYSREDLYAMLSDIASSSWDSIYASASRASGAAGTRPAAQTRGGPASAPLPSPAQAQIDLVPRRRRPALPPAPVSPPPPQTEPRRPRWRRPLHSLVALARWAAVVAACLSLACGAVGNGCDDRTTGASVAPTPLPRASAESRDLQFAGVRGTPVIVFTPIDHPRLTPPPPAR